MNCISTFSEKQIKWKTVSKLSIELKSEIEKMFLPEKELTALMGA